MRRLFSLLILFVHLLPMAGCGEKAAFRNDLPCEDLIAAVSTLPEEDFLVFGEDHIRYSFENTDHFTDCRLIYSARSENIDEIGIFLCETDADVAQIRRLCEQYVTTLRDEQRAFVASYAPREAVKLDTATVHVLGRYVVYTVLSEEDTERVIKELENILRESF